MAVGNFGDFVSYLSFFRLIPRMIMGEQKVESTHTMMTTVVR